MSGYIIPTNNLLLTDTLLAEVGHEGAQALKDQIRETIEAETGRSWTWEPNITLQAWVLEEAGP